MDTGNEQKDFSTPPELNDGSRDVLLKELDILKDLFSETDNRIEGLFNSYLTFLTAVVGGIAILSQIARLDNLQFVQSLSVVLLLFIALVGMMYSVSIAHRYADFYRYAIGVDELRRYLLSTHHIPLPKIYDEFKTTEQSLQEVPGNFTYWLKSVGTYHMFTVGLDSIAFAISVGLFLWIRQFNPVLVVLVTILAFWITFLAQNYYARSNGLLRSSRLNLLLNVNRINFINKKESQ